MKLNVLWLERKAVIVDSIFSNSSLLDIVSLHHFDNYSDALDALSLKKYDIVISGYFISDKQNGIDFLNQAKKLDASVKLIVFTGTLKEFIMDSSEKSIHFIGKPDFFNLAIYLKDIYADRLKGD